MTDIIQIRVIATANIHSAEMDKSLRGIHRKLKRKESKDTLKKDILRKVVNKMEHEKVRLEHSRRTKRNIKLGCFESNLESEQDPEDFKMKPMDKIKTESKIKREPMMDFKMECDVKSEQDSADFQMKRRKKPEGKIKLEGHLKSDRFEQDPTDFKLKPKREIKLESKIKTEPRNFELSELKQDLANIKIKSEAISEQDPADFKIKPNEKIKQEPGIEAELLKPFPPFPFDTLQKRPESLLDSLEKPGNDLFNIEDAYIKIDNGDIHIGHFGVELPNTHPYHSTFGETEKNNFVQSSRIPGGIPLLKSEQFGHLYDTAVIQNMKMRHTHRGKSEKKKAESYIIRKWASQQMGVPFETLNDLACYLIKKNYVEDDDLVATKILAGKRRISHNSTPLTYKEYKIKKKHNAKNKGSLKCKSKDWLLQNPENDISTFKERRLPSSATYGSYSQSLGDTAQLENKHKKSEETEKERVKSETETLSEEDKRLFEKVQNLKKEYADLFSSDSSSDSSTDDLKKNKNVKQIRNLGILKNQRTLPSFPFMTRMNYDISEHVKKQYDNIADDFKKIMNKYKYDNSSTETAKMSTVRLSPQRNVIEEHDFRTIRALRNKPLWFSGKDVKIKSKKSREIRIRLCPPDDYEDFTELLKSKEGYFPASPIIEIEDFDSFLAGTCKEMYIRHNIYDWKKFKNYQIRAYRNLQNIDSYVNIEIELFEDYIKLCGNSSEEKKGCKTETHVSSESSNQHEQSDRSGNSSNDEGYGRNGGSPKLSTKSLVLVAKSEDICDIRLYFARETEENRCPRPHEVFVFAVLDKKSKIAEFLENELPSSGMEEGAHRIRVLMDCDQVYSPILGESLKETPKMIWEERTSFCSFSYSLLNQKRGFMILQKIPPQLMLFCDRRKYWMMKLQTHSGRKPPNDPIYNHGANIVPISCQKFRNVDLQNTSSETASEVKASSTSSDDVTDDLTGRPIEDLPPGPSNHFLINEEPPRKRRKNDDINKNPEVFKCPHCTKTLTRKQTLRDHIHKFHPQHPKELVAEKKETKKTSFENNVPHQNAHTGQAFLIEEGPDGYVMRTSTDPEGNGGAEAGAFLWNEGVQITDTQQLGLAENAVQQTENDPCFDFLDEYLP